MKTTWLIRNDDIDDEKWKFQITGLPPSKPKLRVIGVFHKLQVYFRVRNKRMGPNKRTGPNKHTGWKNLMLRVIPL